MKKKEWTDSLDHLDADVVEKYADQKEKLGQLKARKTRYIRILSVAACLALLVSSALAVPLFLKDDTGLKIDDPPIVFDPTVADRNGNNVDFIVGNSTSSSSSNVSSSAPLEFKFETNDITVKARVVKNLPDKYNVPADSSSISPTVYRVVQMQTLEVIHGENMPQYFMYLIEDRIFTDLSVYDSFLISMIQDCAEKFVLNNVTKNQMEAFDLPLFSDARGRPDLGSIIPFTDGVFDESLWRHWKHGYNSLDNPSKSALVKRGMSESEVITELRLQTEKRHSDYCRWHSVVSLSIFKTQEAKDAIEYATSLENGVFCQSYEPRTGDQPKIYFRRYVNGCPTDELLSINTVTEEVTHSEDRYSAEEIAQMENLSAYLAASAEEYKKSAPRSPHVDPENKKLLCLSLYAWYEKIDGKIYGVLKTSWRYQELDNNLVEYYDEAYILYDTSKAAHGEVSKEELTALLGNNHRHIYRGELGAKIEKEPITIMP